MPCIDYETSALWRAADEMAQNTIENVQLRKQNDRLAKLLCDLCTIVENDAGDMYFSPDVKKWWEKHKKDDKEAQEKRSNKERLAKLKTEALGKLTDEEKKALGLK